jgi:hypothetical protein
MAVHGNFKANTKSLNMKKVFLVAFLTYLVCMGAILVLNEIFIERQSAKDFEGFLFFSAMYFVALTCFIYMPALFLLERRFQGLLRKHYPLITAILLNLPFFVFAVLMSGKAFQPSEAALFTAMVVVVGYTFGKQFMKHRYQTV